MTVLFRSLLLLLVSLFALPALAAFTDNGDGTITDTVTGLMWDKCSWGQSGNADCATGSASMHTWSAALGIAVTANAGSHKTYTDWRLPNRTELESLVKIDANGPTIDATAFPATLLAFFWTSSTIAPDPALAWGVAFNDGRAGTDDKTNAGRVRLVRSGQSFGSFDSMVDITAPVLSSVGVSGTTSSGTTLAATSDEAATGYWIVVARDATAPSAAEAKAGANYGAVTKVASGNAVMTAAVAKTFSVTGLTAGTDYDLYFAAEDGSGNLSAAATKVQFSTAAADTTPAAFSFTDQTNIALSTLTESAAITVAGIDSAAAISVAGGEYQINGGAWVSGAGTVSLNDTVKVRHTSSGSYSTATHTMLTIGGVADTFSTTTLAAPAPDPDPVPPPPPAPTAVTISGPGQSIVAVAGLPIRIAAGANVEGTTISFPANSPIVLELGGAALSVTAQDGGAQLTLHTLAIGGQNVIVIAIGSGSANIESQSAGQYLLVFGAGQTPVQSGSGITRFSAQRNGSDLVLSVGQGNILLPASSFAATRRTTSRAASRAASADMPIHAGERAVLDAAGRVTTHVLGNAAGDGAGDALSLELPANLSIAASVPRLDVHAERLGTTLQQAIAAAAGGSVDVGQTNGVLRLGLDGQRLYVLPLGEASVDADAADGVSLAADGTAIVTAQGVRVTLAPSVANLGRLAEDLAATLPGAMVTVRENGLIVVTAGNATYVVRPDWVTQLKANMPAGFSSDAAGQLSYAQDVRVIVLHPAFADFARLEAAVRQAMLDATATTNPDGTVTVVAGENRWTLTPLHSLETAPAGQSAWWADDAGRLWLKNGDGTMQEFRIE